MEELFKYSGLATKIRAMQSHILTDEDYNTMVHMGTVKEVALYLKKCPAYSDALRNLDENNIHRGQIEKKLIFSMYKDYSKIYKFSHGTDRGFLNTYFIYFEIEIIKVLLRMLLDSRPVEYDLLDFEAFFMEHSKINIKKLSKANNLAEFVECLKDTPYYNILSLLSNGDNITLFDIEMRLDMYYFSQTWKLREKYLDKESKEALTVSIGTEIDLLNIFWIYRAKTYYSVDKEIIYSYLIPVRYKLKTEQIKQIVEAKGQDELDAEIKKTAYAKVIMDFDPGDPEKSFYRILGKLQSQASRNHPMSLASVKQFMYCKRVEIANITKVVEGIRYGLEPARIKDYLNICNKNGGAEN
jgi:V/A-type H+-transporting ATPase subunit C